MSGLGKRLRMKRLINQRTGRSIIFAIDHGMTSPRMLEGIEDTRARVREAIAGGANVVMLSRNFAKIVAEEFRPETSLALLLTASAAICPKPLRVVPIGGVEEALRLGADAVVAFVALGGENDPEMIKFVGQVGEACERLGMPFIAEAEYPTTYQPLDSLKEDYGVDYLKYSSRLCAELGADIVKTNWTGDVESFRELVKSTSVPVVVAGGSPVSDEELLHRVADAIEAGAIGCSVGRNIFQHRNPQAITRAIVRVVGEGWTPEEALQELSSILMSESTTASS